jgi:hypothetical protein
VPRRNVLEITADQSLFVMLDSDTGDE